MFCATAGPREICLQESKLLPVAGLVTRIAGKYFCNEKPATAPRAFDSKVPAKGNYGGRKNLCPWQEHATRMEQAERKPIHEPYRMVTQRLASSAREGVRKSLVFQTGIFERSHALESTR
jgi:hypothetical protein